ncbi:hypothetical protein JTE90_026232 [Oedothorax gibbosus]|uniref:Uncharacterized protein n=1 Tax=Oedothorax gibbosus TaxID=931172 RepID=A0AAV6UAL7_9ARAC|nr:hypothetical protein JTE90_026232 [Oedothorax gibbosus]
MLAPFPQLQNRISIRIDIEKADLTGCRCGGIILILFVLPECWKEIFYVCDTPRAFFAFSIPVIIRILRDIESAAFG